MNPRAKTTGDDPTMPAHTRGLWAEACGWVAWLLGRFDRNALKTTGISREDGVRLSTWLMNIESAIRRIIIIAALTLAPPPPRQTRTCAAARVAAAASSPRRSGFRVFRLNGGGGTSPHAGTHTSEVAKPYGHVPFAPDPLLSLGAAPPSTPRDTPTQTPAPRTRNPLDRWVRPCRQDPDWRPPEHNDPGYRIVRGPIAVAGYRVLPQPKAIESTPNSLHPSLLDWRRRYDAWTQPVPAPDLAARLEALAHVVSNPAAIIANAARRLHGSAANAPPLMRRAPPDPRLPRRAAHIETLSDAYDLARRCHAHLAPDTS